MSCANRRLGANFHPAGELQQGEGSVAKQATFETIDDAGHYSMLETPVRVASIIAKQMAAAG